jgi:pyruvate,orthophosphate dikinase
MVRIGLPVPHGFTVSTEACNAFLKSGGTFPTGMWDQVLSALKTVETKQEKRFGGDDNPLLVSCRSGAKFSMPGMMDTVLNIGLNSQTVAAMIRLTDDPRFVYDAYRRLIQMFGSVVMGIDDEPFEAVITAARKAAGVENDTELSRTTGSRWRNSSSPIPTSHHPRLSRRSLQTAQNGHRGGV